MSDFTLGPTFTIIDFGPLVFSPLLLKLGKFGHSLNFHAHKIIKSLFSFSNILEVYGELDI